MLLLPVWLSWLDCHPIHQQVGSLIPGQDAHLDCGFSPQLGCIWEGNQLVFLSHIDVTLFLSLPFSLPLKSINIYKIFKKDFKYFKWLRNNGSCIFKKFHPLILILILIFEALLKIIFIFHFFIVQVQLSPLSCYHFPMPHPPPPPTLNLSPLWLCPWVLYTCSLMTHPLFSPIISPPSPLVNVSLFFISMSLLTCHNGLYVYGMYYVLICMY